MRLANDGPRAVAASSSAGATWLGEAGHSGRGSQTGHFAGWAEIGKTCGSRPTARDAGSQVTTPEGEVTVVVPSDEEEEVKEEEADASAPAAAAKAPDARQSIQTQAKLAEIGAIMGFRIWVPSADRARVLDLVPPAERTSFVEALPVNTNEATLDTIKQIDVLWLRRGSIVRAFEVEHTTAVYSGLLRMADFACLAAEHGYPPSYRGRTSVATKCSGKCPGRSSCRWSAVLYRKTVRSSLTRALTQSTV